MNHPLAILILILCVSLSSCAHKKDTASTPADTGDVVILATTDFHAAVERAEAMGATIRDLQKKYAGRTVTVSAGDLFQGSIEGNTSKGKAVIDFFNAIPMTVVAMGNHDIDYGPARTGSIVPQRGEQPRGALTQRAKESQFPWITANVVYKTGKAPQGHRFKNALGRATIFAPHHIMEVNGAKVCLIGATTPTTPFITLPAFVADLDFLPLKETVEAEAKHLRQNENCDAIVLVTHAGLVCPGSAGGKDAAKEATGTETGRCLGRGDLAELLPMLEALPEGTLDAVVGGHTHIKAQEIIHGTPVIEAAAHGKGVGALHLKIDRTTHKTRFVGFEQFDTAASALTSTAPTADITAALKPYRLAAERMKARIMGKINAPLSLVYREESAFANAVAQALKDSKPGLDAGIMNAGGIRHHIQGPVVTYNDVFKSLPFDNYLATVQGMRGSQLRRLIEIGTSGAHGGTGYAGLHIKAYDIAPEREGPWNRDLNGDGKKQQWERNVVMAIEVESRKTPGRFEPLRDEATYRVATIDFLASGGDHAKVVYDKIEKSRVKVYYHQTTREVFGEFLSRHGDGLNPEDYLSPTTRRVQWIPYSEKSNKN